MNKLVLTCKDNIWEKALDYRFKDKEYCSSLLSKKDMMIVIEYAKLFKQSGRHKGMD